MSVRKIVAFPVTAYCIYFTFSCQERYVGGYLVVFTCLPVADVLQCVTSTPAETESNQYYEEYSLWISLEHSPRSRSKTWSRAMIMSTAASSVRVMVSLATVNVGGLSLTSSTATLTLELHVQLGWEESTTRTSTMCTVDRESNNRITFVELSNFTIVWTQEFYLAF